MVKNRRIVDWTKIKKEAKFLPILWASMFLLIFSFSYFSVRNNNDLRNTVASNSTSTTAKVLDIAGGKGAHYATYEFAVNGVKVTGTTLHTYHGNVGDEICINYYKPDASINIYCSDASLETFEKDVLEYTFSITGVTIIGSFILIPLSLLISAVTGNKKVLAEVTSRKSNYA
ncbi:hypothetical protein GZH53_06020 [Flavihumibacter sp. R14]|nr:hypothetical protein [Flavihumibacter soli]